MEAWWREAEAREPISAKPRQVAGAGAKDACTFGNSKPTPHSRSLDKQRLEMLLFIR